MKIKKITSAIIALTLACTSFTGTLVNEVSANNGDTRYEQFRTDFLSGMDDAQLDNSTINNYYSITSNALLGEAIPFENYSTMQNNYSMSADIMTIDDTDSLPTGPYDMDTNNERKFYISGESNSFVAKDFKLVGQSDNVNIWLINETVGIPIEVTDEMLEILCEKTQSLYESMTTTIAPHTQMETVYDYNVGDVDNDEALNILLYDIKGDSGISYDVDGYFRPSDFYGTTLTSPVDVIHLDIGEQQGGLYLQNEKYDTFCGIIAHEFQHLLYQSYLGWKVTSADTLWINESLSGVADLYYATGTYTGYQTPKSGFLAAALYMDYDKDFLNFSGYKSYGMGYYFSSFMHNKFGANYIKGLYEYFDKVELKYDNQYILKDGFGNTLTSTSSTEEVNKKIIGGAIKYITQYTSDLSSEEVFEYTYRLFMESFLSDGGTLADDTSVTYPKLWAGADMWYYRSYFSSYIPTISDGGKISLTGGTTITSGATHENLYKLNTDTTNKILNITVGDSNTSETLYAYVALYNNSYSNRNADIFPLELGKVNEIDTTGKTPYLFVSTIYEDISNVNVSYTWSLEKNNDDDSLGDDDDSLGNDDDNSGNDDDNLGNDDDNLGNDDDNLGNDDDNLGNDNNVDDGYSEATIDSNGNIIITSSNLPPLLDLNNTNGQTDLKLASLSNSNNFYVKTTTPLSQQTTITLPTANNNDTVTWTIPAGTVLNDNVSLIVRINSANYSNSFGNFEDNQGLSSNGSITFYHSGSLINSGSGLKLEFPIPYGTISNDAIITIEKSDGTDYIYGNLVNTNKINATFTNCSTWYVTSTVETSNDSNDSDSTGQFGNSDSSSDSNNSNDNSNLGGNGSDSTGQFGNSNSSSNYDSSTNSSTSSNSVSSNSSISSSISYGSGSIFGDTNSSSNSSTSSNVVYYGNSNSNSNSSSSSNNYIVSGESNVTTGINIPYSSSWGYIPEFHNLVVGQLINLNKITINGMQVGSWYYDEKLTQQIESPMFFVVTSSVIQNGIYNSLSDGTLNNSYSYNQNQDYSNSNYNYINYNGSNTSNSGTSGNYDSNYIYYNGSNTSNSGTSGNYDSNYIYYNGSDNSNSGTSGNYGSNYIYYNGSDNSSSSTSGNYGSNYIYYNGSDNSSSGASGNYGSNYIYYTGAESSQNYSLYLDNYGNTPVPSTSLYKLNKLF